MSGANQTKPPSRSGATVTIGCKLPHGMILQLNRMEDHDEPVMGGGTKTVKRAIAYGPRVFIRGIAHPQNEAPKALIIDGYAMTPGVDAEFFAEWVKQHPDADVLNKEHPLLKAFERPGDAEGWAHEHAAVRSGQERLNPDKLPNSGGRFKVETAAAGG